MTSSSTASIDMKFYWLGQTVRFSVELENIQLLPPNLPLTVLFDSAFQMIYNILVHPILVEPVERVISLLEANSGEVCLSR